MGEASPPPPAESPPNITSPEKDGGAGVPEVHSRNATIAGAVGGFRVW